MNHQHRIAAAGSGVAALALASCLALTGCSGGQPSISAAGRPAASGPALPSGSGPSLSVPSLSVPSAGAASADRSLVGIHACSLVPASVVTQVLGSLSEPASGDGLLCFYNTQLSAGEGGPSYVLTVLTRSGYEAAKAFSTGVGESGAAKFASVTGLGADAYSLSTDSGGPAYSLSAAKGGVAVNVEVDDLGTGRAKARELVAAALAHL
ncbi:MAG TPA: hypothetical protein VMC83_06460 [Streptosporangiaceae bacterium]|nr:hypothetical protein [Streptosporangiaceae bacterium]